MSRLLNLLCFEGSLYEIVLYALNKIYKKITQSKVYKLQDFLPVCHTAHLIENAMHNRLAQWHIFPIFISFALKKSEWSYGRAHCFPLVHPLLFSCFSISPRSQCYLPTRRTALNRQIGNETTPLCVLIFSSFFHLMNIILTSYKLHLKAFWHSYRTRVQFFLKIFNCGQSKEKYLPFEGQGQAFNFQQAGMFIFATSAIFKLIGGLLHVLKIDFI